MKFPSHEAGLYLTHNEHKDCYNTVSDFINDAHPSYDEDDFVSPEDMQKCIDTNECWVLHWYPVTPVGFHRVCGSSLEIVMARAMEIDAKLKEGA